MDLPKNITQIGETDHSCKIYVEDYVISYIKQLNVHAKDKEIAVALYGKRMEEAGVTYFFFYGACRIIFLQRESRHLSQAVQQETEELRQKYFPQYTFLGYRMLNGEMVEGFHVYEHGICRYISGYAQFYEKNDTMLAFMLESRKEAVKPEEVDQEKYEEVKKRQEERRQQSEEQETQALLHRRQKRPVPQNAAQNLRNMKYGAAAVFVLLFVAGFAAMNGADGLNDLQSSAMQMLDEVNTQQLPDAVEVSNGSAQAGTIVTEDKLTDALLQENAAAAGQVTQWPTVESQQTPTQEPQSPTQQPQQTPAEEQTPEPTQEPVSGPVSYTIRRGDTLIGICIAQYGTDEKVAEVCSFNGITNPDDIKVGQKILLP